VLGALIGVVGYAVLVDRGGDDESNRPAAAAPTPTSEAVPTGVAVYQTLIPSLVLVTASDGDPALGSIGSGVVIDEDGQILTAHHVLDGATEVDVVFADGTRSAAQVVGTDPDNDLAILAPAQLPEVVVPAVLGGGVRIGDEVYPLGNPFGFSGTLTAGVVSGLDRTLLRGDGRGELADLIQFDAAVNPGSSGGPLVDARGQVVGIVTALANPTQASTFVGLGFAVPIETASQVAGSLDR
jgi:S1-C subfamily serine protease